MRYGPWASGLDHALHDVVQGLLRDAATHKALVAGPEPKEPYYRDLHRHNVEYAAGLAEIARRNGLWRDKERGGAAPPARDAA